MPSILYLTGRSYRGAPMAAHELPPQEQAGHALLAQAAQRLGFDLEIAYWDDPDLPARGAAGAIIRSCWDYHERPAQFVEALEAHERAGLRVLNAPDVVRWNMRKTYLKELGGAAIETIWADRADARAVAQAFEALDAAEIVIKPQVGAGSRETVRLKRNAWSEADLIGAPREAAMIQPFLNAIQTEGERSLFWFGGQFSHAIRKAPAPGDWLANIPGKTTFMADPAPPEALAAAEAARARAPQDLLYVRIDLVLGDDGRWRVIEIEAIEPYLFFDFAPEAADVFAGVIARVFGL
ncbi:MAG TPA: transporter [Terricaulis sp.]|nr:transporter [Terricaulis sp.]